MRWCLFILNLFLLLTLGMEQCCWCAAAGGMDASQHLACVLDDDAADAVLKQGLPPEKAFSDWCAPARPDWHAVIRLAHAALVAPLEKAENREVPTGIRRHRWLCQERC